MPQGRAVAPAGVEAARARGLKAGVPADSALRARVAGTREVPGAKDPG
jgi:hypothetical protein